MTSKYDILINPHILEVGTRGKIMSRILEFKSTQTCIVMVELKPGSLYIRKH
jgi:hypothetical protein